MLVMFFVGAVLGGLIAYRLGWNRCVKLYERRAVESAHSRAEADRK